MKKIDVWEVVAYVVMGLIGAVTIWAICALIAVKREQVRLDRQAEHDRYIHVHLNGGAK